VSISVHFSSVTGTPTDGTTITGGTSGTQAQISVTNSFAAEHVMILNQGGGTGFSLTNFSPPETLTSSGFSGTLDVAIRGDHFDDNSQTTGNVAGCACTQPPFLCATGPSATFETPALVIYDPDKLDLVKAGTAVDYQQIPDTLVALTAAPFSLVLNHNIWPFGAGGAGGWIDSAHNKMYLIFNGQDDLTVPVEVQSVIARFSISDSAPPAPLVPTYAFLMLGFTSLMFSRRKQ